MQQIVIYILCAVGGGVVAVVAFLVALRMLSRESSSTTISFGSPRVFIYKHIELLAYDKRPGGVYVKFRNTGDKPLTTVVFDVRVFDGEGNLVDQLEYTLYQRVPAGATEEGIVKAMDYRSLRPVDLDGDKIEVRVKYGYIE